VQWSPTETIKQINRMNTIENLSGLPFLFHSLVKGLMVQKKFIQKTISHDIIEIKKNLDNSLTEKDFNKITGYYGLAVPAILGESFCLLRGYPMTLKERYAMTYLGALSGLFDDFFDERNTPESQIKTLIENPNECIPSNSHELLFIRFYKKVLEYTEDIGLLKSCFTQVYLAQVLSKKQKLPETDTEEIKSITFQKGGFSFLLYRSVLSESANEAEDKMIYHLGGLFQLENDLFDVHKDYIQNIRTLATTETKIKNLRTTYTTLMEELFTLVHHTNLPMKNRYRFLRFLSLIILRGFVCLDTLENNEKSTNNSFSIKDYKRKNIICDMEKPINIIKLVHYYTKLNIVYA
jgi:hypothetical protein